MWSEIKRGGAAIAMGHHVAANIHLLIVQQLFGTRATLLEYPEVKPAIAVALGKKAVSYWEGTDVTASEEMMQTVLEGDLEHAIYLEYLQLKTEWVAAAPVQVVENEKVSEFLVVPAVPEAVSMPVLKGIA